MRVILVVVALGAGFWWLSAGAVVGRGEIHPIDTHFGDPFAVEWQALERLGSGGATAPYRRPPPMVSVGGRCLGFGRLDWADTAPSPSVAHCVDGGSVERLGPNGVAVVRESVAGDSTWQLLVFGGDVEHLEVRLDDADDLGPERVFLLQRFAAVLVPAGVKRLELRWTVVGGGAYECGVGAGTLLDQRCT